ncbi:hypothetical protein [Planomonospora sp. ID82291]|uniref:hypothetical protein n=1 Tax=Planomonospora sp. ID82291 TaxID=2738136 RepID=UPI0018C384C1|nr:hypothetical protein [Planomonospora sp. ID82291]MBG0818943.1 hypothetical protein [Planomonospora sp. ID82291]
MPTSPEQTGPAGDSTAKDWNALWRSVVAHAMECAELAANADPANLGATSDYEDARQALAAALQRKPMLFNVHGAAHRFHKSLGATEDLSARLASGGLGPEELDLLFSAQMLGKALYEFDAAGGLMTQGATPKAP